MIEPLATEPQEPLLIEYEEAHREDLLDEALQESYPASDPVASFKFN